MLPNPFHLAGRWYREDGSLVAGDPERTRLAPTLESGDSAVYDVAVIAPTEPGTYVLRLTAVQELVAWFDDRPTLTIESGVDVW
jgi:hypothetical protein